MKYKVKSVHSSLKKSGNTTFQAYINKLAFDSEVTVDSEDPKLEFTLRKFAGLDNTFEDFNQILDCTDLSSGNQKEFVYEKSFGESGFKRKITVSL